ncbi:putative SH3 domain protein [Trypanosoma cruzi]|nr:putative SH3 domain protein [Trypanosoma cruzi]
MRQRRSTVVPRITDIFALGQLHEKGERVGSRNVCPPTWKQRMSLAGQFTTFCRTHEQPINEKSCAVILMAILDVAPSTRPQHARMLRSVLRMDRTPLDMMILGLKETAARSETKQQRQQSRAIYRRCACASSGRNSMAPPMRTTVNENETARTLRRSCFSATK